LHEVTGQYRTRPGTRLPPGARLHADGVNFCIAGRHATNVWLVLYAHAESPEPCQVIALDPVENHSGFFWHIFVVGLKAGSCYTWRMRGPTDTSVSGLRFDERVELLDPWALAVSDRLWDRASAADAGRRLRGVVTQAPKPRPRSRARGLEGAVIYELHVGGFTRHPSAGVAAPGTFAGLMQKIPYLRELGITHVELLPVMAFDAQDVPPPVAARGLHNFWGYSTYGFLAPHPGYCLDQAQAPLEFRTLVDALHAAGIGVILDVVFNHTAEGGEDGPVISFKGISNDIFYHLDPADGRRYLDFTGCGNTLNCNHPLVAAFILFSLEYWAGQLGVDGFRFDLASVLVRGPGGAPLENPPLPWMIEFSSVLSSRCLIAEAWDAAGLYHLGAFPGMDWSEWNGHYRDVMRRFVRGEPGLVSAVATKLSGSADLYGDDGRKPVSSVNFITCHDGFTLHDVVSYGRKHNAANGEDNRDGSEENFSWNCGVEGATTDPAVLALRHRQAKNLLALLLLSRGVPMLLAGDEVLRTQGGNNNAWCQDNATGWFDWDLVAQNADFLRFTRELIALRRRHACLTANRFFSGAPTAGRDRPDITWHGTQLDEPLWPDPGARVLACTISALAPGEEDLHLVLNMADETLQAPLPAPGRSCWHLALDTSLSAPQDIQPPLLQRPVKQATYTVAPRSVVLLEARSPARRAGPVSRKAHVSRTA
jgi:isoamylase